MKKLFIPLAAALLLGLSACGGNTVSSSEVPSSDPTSSQPSSDPSSEPSSSEGVYNSVAISNKDELTPTWYLGEGNRSLSVTCDPATNINQAFIDGVLVSASSDTGVVTVSNRTLAAVAPGTATITVTYGGKVSDTVDITVAEVPTDAINTVTYDKLDTVVHVRGVITQIGSGNAPIIDDGTGAILLYGFSVGEEFKLGDYVDVNGTVAEYHNTLQLKSCTVVKYDGTAPTPTLNTPDVLDPATVDEKYKNDAETYVTLKPVTFWGTAFMSGSYQAVYVQDVNTTMLIEPTTWGGDWEVGQVYNITGYLGAFYASYSYAALYITELEERVIEMTSFTLATADGTNNVFVGGTQQLSVVPTPANANQLDVTWVSSNTAVATVDENGLVSGIAAGEVTITATHTIDGGTPLTATITLGVTVPPDVESVALDQTSVSGIHGEKTVTLKATVSPAGSNQAVTWTSSDETVATVDADGVVTGLKAGTATITATTVGTTSAGATVSATCSVTAESIPVGTAENPLDSEVWGKWVDEDTSVNKSYGDDPNYIVGTVSEADAYSEQYGNYGAIYLKSASGLTLEFYRAKVAEGATGVVAGDDLNGKVLVVRGETKYHNGTIELGTGCEIVSAEDAPVEYTTEFTASSGNLAGWSTELSNSYTTSEVTKTIGSITYAGLGVASAAASAWSENLLVLAARSGRAYEESYVKMSGETFTSLTLNFHWWANNAAFSFVIEYSEDGETWVAASEVQTASNDVDYSVAQSISTNVNFSAPYVRIHGSNTTVNSNLRIGIDSITYTRVEPAA